MHGVAIHDLLVEVLPRLAFATSAISGFHHSPWYSIASRSASRRHVTPSLRVFFLEVAKAEARARKPSTSTSSGSFTNDTHFVIASPMSKKDDGQPALAELRVFANHGGTTEELALPQTSQLSLRR